jgi:hypothetical protein
MQAVVINCEDFKIKSLGYFVIVKRRLTSIKLNTDF